MRNQFIDAGPRRYIKPDDLPIVVKRAVGTKHPRGWCKGCRRISLSFKDAMFDEIATAAQKRNISFAAMARSLIRAGLRAQ